MSPDDPRHGTNAGHLAHIFDREAPCDPCREAHNLVRRNLWRKKYARRVDRLYVDATGTVRRIRALQALGWRYRDIDEAAGRGGRNWAHNLTTQARVHLDTAELVEAVYDRLSMTPGPSDRVRKHAQKMRWAPPLAWDDIDHDEAPRLGGPSVDLDPVVVERLLAGERIRSTPAEKAEAMRRWTASGRSEKALCDIHGWRAGRYNTRREDAA